MVPPDSKALRALVTRVRTADLTDRFRSRLVRSARILLRAERELAKLTSKWAAVPAP